MGNPTTPLPTVVPDLEQDLRESHVRLKDVPRTEAEWEEVERSLTPALPERHLRLVSTSPTPSEQPAEDDDAATVIPFQRASRGIVAAERAHITDDAEARFHHREAIEHAVRIARETSATSPAAAAHSRSTVRRSPAARGALLVGVIVLCALVATVLLLLRS